MPSDSFDPSGRRAWRKQFRSGGPKCAGWSASTSSTITASALTRGSATGSSTRLRANYEESVRSNAARGSVGFFGIIAELPRDRLSFGTVRGGDQRTCLTPQVVLRERLHRLVELAHGVGDHLRHRHDRLDPPRDLTRQRDARLEIAL